MGYSVEIGHELLGTAVPLELQEMQSVYKLSHQEEIEKKKLVRR